VADISVRMETGRVFLTYRYRANGSEWESLNYPVTLDSTPCTYGNLRYWFHCPAVGCGRRVALLYLGGRYFACRHCYNLAYASQRESDGGRALNRAQRIREKMGGSANLFEPFPWKPKGMHWRTYSRLRNQAEQSSNQSMLYA